MKFFDETVSRTISFEDLNIGDVFIECGKQFLMKIESVTTVEGYEYNAINLQTGKLGYFCKYDYLQFAEAELHYKIQT